MRIPKQSVVLAVAVCLALPLIVTAADEPNLNKEQIKQFLLTTKVVSSKQLNEDLWRLTLSDGKLTHDAAFQKNILSYRHKIGAYILAEMIGFDDMMPVAVERKWQGNSGSFSWWLPLKMDEAERLKRRLAPPDLDGWNRQMYKVQVFDQLVDDQDPMDSRVYIGEDWKIWRLDFTNAFRLRRNLEDPKKLVRCDRRLFENLKKLDGAELEQKTKQYLTEPEALAVMARRGKIVNTFRRLIAQKGEGKVLY